MQNCVLFYRTPTTAPREPSAPGGRKCFFRRGGCIALAGPSAIALWQTRAALFKCARRPSRRIGQRGVGRRERGNERESCHASWSKRVTRLSSLFRGAPSGARAPSSDAGSVGRRFNSIAARWVAQATVGACGKPNSRGFEARSLSHGRRCKAPRKKFTVSFHSAPWPGATLGKGSRGPCPRT